MRHKRQLLLLPYTIIHLIFIFCLVKGKKMEKNKEKEEKRKKLMAKVGKQNSRKLSVQTERRIKKGLKRMKKTEEKKREDWLLVMDKYVEIVQEQRQRVGLEK